MTQCPYSYFDYCAEAEETFASIAKKFSASEKVIKELNDSIHITQGMKVKIPCKYGGCGRGAFYAIKKGETLFEIARRNGISLDMLLGANPYLNPSYYIHGQIIIIPQCIQQTSDKSYKLGENEGLFDVLRKFGMDVTTFCVLNPNADPMDLKCGQRVNVISKKASDTPGKWHTINSKENVLSVANKFGIKVSTLLAANENLRPSEFSEGITVRIPQK